MSEDICEECGRENIWSWSVDSDRWNVAMEALGLDVGAITCPVCFVDAHELATGLRTTWRLVPDSFHHIGSIRGERPPRATAREKTVDYEAARRVDLDWISQPGDMVRVRAIVDAALADYLTEEGP